MPGVLVLGMCRVVIVLLCSQILEALEQGQRLQQPQGCPDNIYEMMQECWKFLPSERPDFVYLSLFTQRRSEDY